MILEENRFFGDKLLQLACDSALDAPLLAAWVRRAVSLKEATYKLMSVLAI